MSYTFNLTDPRSFTDDEIAEGIAFRNVLNKEVFPGDPPARVEDAIAQHKTIPEQMILWNVRARDEQGSLVGTIGGGVDPDHDDNPDVYWGSPSVLPEHRRNGLGSQLLAYAVAKAKADGRTRMMSGTNERVPAGSAFAQSIGAESKTAEHLNHLVVADVDRDMLQRWAAEGPGRAEGYELIWVDSPIEAMYMQKYLDLALVMNTAPRDDLQINDFTISEKQIRDGEKSMAAVGATHWSLIARRVTDDDWAGFHDMSWHPSQPNYMWIHSTGVRPEHRGHALGKWLKAAMMQRIFKERPNITEIRTGNADSNDAMLGINKQMGYKPMISSSTWEVPTEKVEAWLAERGVQIPAV